MSIILERPVQILLCDPPWAYPPGYMEQRGVVTAGDVYQGGTMSYAEIAAIPVGQWADKDCLLACWTTWPKLAEGVDLVRAWGFEYLTGVPWIKTVSTTIRRGIGHWTMSCSEPLLLGRRGTPARRGPNPKMLGLLEGEDRQFYAPGGKVHSRKPYGIHEWLTEQFTGPYLELFARRERKDGWTCWGGDLGYWLSPEGVKYRPELIKPQPQGDLFG